MTEYIHVKDCSVEVRLNEDGYHRCFTPQGVRLLRTEELTEEARKAVSEAKQNAR